LSLLFLHSFRKVAEDPGVEDTVVTLAALAEDVRVEAVLEALVADLQQAEGQAGNSNTNLKRANCLVRFKYGYENIDNNTKIGII